MKIVSVLIFGGVFALGLLVAAHRFTDSAHSIGLIKSSGGQARHPVVFTPGYDRYTLVATAAVIPPYRGDARVVVEGLPGMDYRVLASEPAIDLSPWRQPVLRDQVLYDLRPKDRIALWVILQPKPGAAPAVSPPVAAPTAAGSPADCCHDAAPASRASGPEGGPQLAFYDVKSGNRLLAMPIDFRTGGADGQAH